MLALSEESLFLDPYFSDFERDTSVLPYIWKLNYLFLLLNNSTISALEYDIQKIV